MSAFLPSRVSPRPSPRTRAMGRIPNLNSMDITTTSATSSVSAALSGLSSKDVRLIDEIIERSPPSATTFLTVFKAYNEVLQEHGIDASNDVVYYKILLKLGVVKGMDWGTKWRTVKEQQGYGYGKGDNDDEDEEEHMTPRNDRVAALRGRGGIRVERSQSRDILAPSRRHRVGTSRPSAAKPPLSLYGADSITVHSHRDDDASEAVESEAATETETETGLETETGTDATRENEPEFSSPPTTLIQRERASDTKENALRLTTEPSYYPPLPTVDQFLPVHARRRHSNFPGTSEFSSDVYTRTSTPPPPPPKAPEARSPLQPIRQSNVPVPPVRPRTSRPAAKQSSHDLSINDEDTWKKLKIIRDEKEADKFREIMLLERCWEVWKGSLQWLTTMNEKVDEERGKALTHDHLQKWRLRLRKRQNDYQQIGQRHDRYLLQTSFARWRSRAKAVQTTKWKEDMRRRMSLIRTKRDERIREDAWIKWRQVHQGEVAILLYEQSLVRRIFRMWRGGLAKIGRLETAADELILSRDDAQLSRAWDFWKLQADLRDLEKMVRVRVESRMKEDAVQIWRQKMSVNHKADVFHDCLVKKHFYQAWKRTLSRQHTMARKAIKYRNRQDGILLLAVLHMWRARERGILMDRARNAQSLYNAWVAWKSRLSDVNSSEARAIEFRNRPSSVLVKAALNRWRQIVIARRNLLSQAEQYDRDILLHRTLLIWRVQLRVKLKMAKHAKVARKYLLMRQAWTRWKEMVEEKKREQRLQLLQLKVIRKYFGRWRATCTRQQYHQLALKQVQVAISTRILASALTKWTNLVITLKLRELEVVEKRDQKTFNLCYGKWKDVFKRHADDLRLMQSYQYVKREEILRRMFSKWHSATKTNRHRRFLLQEREDEMKLVIVEKAWDRWRERFKAERLRPLEYKLAIQLEKSRLYQAYLLWHSRTRSIPAIQLFSLRTKAKHWRIWREAMPKALQAREARRLEREKVLSRVLDKWTQAYRTKIALKAVARARYLRLPSGAPRKSLPLSYALHGVLRSSPSVTSGRATRPVSPSADDRLSEPARSVQEEDSASKAGLSRLANKRLSALHATKLSIARPPYNSDVPDEKNRNLWHELRRAHRRPRSEGAFTRYSTLAHHTSVPSSRQRRLYLNSGVVDVLGRGNNPDNPIDVDDDNWFPGQVTTGIELNGYDSDSGGGVTFGSGFNYSQDENSKCTPESEEPMDAESLTRNTPPNSSSLLGNGDGMKQKQVRSWMPARKQRRSRLTGVGNKKGKLGGFYARATIGPACSSRTRYNAKSTLSPDEKERMDLHGSESEMDGPGSDRSASQQAERKRALSESPFFIPVGEEALWREPGAETGENQIYSHSTEVEVHRAIAARAAYNTDLPLDLFIGDVNFEGHATIEPSSVPFRRSIVEQELKNHKTLKIEGKSGAMKAMKDLGIIIPVKGNGKNKQIRH